MGASSTLSSGASPSSIAGEIDHRLEGRARLAVRLRRPVEHALRVVAAAHHGTHGAALIQRDQGALLDLPALPGGGQRLGKRSLRRPLACGIEGREHPERPVVAPDITRHLLAHPIDEVAGGWAATRGHGEGLHARARRFPFVLAEEVGVHHRIDDDARTPARQCEVVGRAVARGSLQQARDHGGLGHVDIARRAAEIAPRRRVDAVGAGAEIGAVEVDGQDFFLGELALQPEGEHRLLNLAADGALRREEHQLRHLLGDRAAARHHAPLDRVLPGRADHAEGVDAAVGVEAPVLDRENRLGQHRRHLLDRHQLAPHLAHGGNLGAVRRQHGDRERRLGPGEVLGIGQVVGVIADESGAQHDQPEDEDGAPLGDAPAKPPARGLGRPAGFRAARFRFLGRRPGRFRRGLRLFGSRLVLGAAGLGARLRGLLCRLARPLRRRRAAA